MLFIISLLWRLYLNISISICCLWHYISQINNLCDLTKSLMLSFMMNKKIKNKWNDIWLSNNIKTFSYSIKPEQRSQGILGNRKFARLLIIWLFSWLTAPQLKRKTPILVLIWVIFFRSRKSHFQLWLRHTHSSFESSHPE